MSGCRYVRSIKQSLNKLFNNTASINFELAKIIADYSHKTIVRPGTIMFGHSEYFIVKRVYSQHWIQGFFCPPKLILNRHNQSVMIPRINMRSRLYKKRVFDAFKKPEVRIRLKRFTLGNEPL